MRLDIGVIVSYSEATVWTRFQEHRVRMRRWQAKMPSQALSAEPTGSLTSRPPRAARTEVGRNRTRSDACCLSHPDCHPEDGLVYDAEALKAESAMLVC